MKLIDILIKTINGEETPDKFIYEQNIFTKENNGGYTDEDGDNLIDWIFTDYSNLNDEVKIIQEDKKIKKLSYYSLEEIQKAKNIEEHIEKRIQLLEKRMDDYHNKINEIIDKLEEIK